MEAPENTVTIEDLVMVVVQLRWLTGRRIINLEQWRTSVFVLTLFKIAVYEVRMCDALGWAKDLSFQNKKKF